MLSEQEQSTLDSLTAKKASGEQLKPKERALLVQLQKKAQSKEADSTESKESPVKSNVFGSVEGGAVSTYKIKPTSVRFVQAERDVLSARANDLKANSLGMIIERLGSVSQVNETKLIRAAVLALADMTDEQVIEYIKKAQRNMVGR